MGVVRVSRTSRRVARRRDRDRRRPPRPARELRGGGRLHLPDLASHGDKNFSAGVWGLVTGRERPRPRETARRSAQGRLPQRPLGLLPPLPPRGRRLRPLAGLRSPPRDQRLPGGLHLGSAPEGNLHPADVPRAVPVAHHPSRRAVGELPRLHGPRELEARERRPLRAELGPGRGAALRAIRDRGRCRRPARVLPLEPLPRRGGDRGEAQARRPGARGGSAASTRHARPAPARGVVDALPARHLPDRGRAEHRPPAPGRLRPDRRGHEGPPQPLARTSSSTASSSTTPRTRPSARTPDCAGPSTREATSS